jgi:hypothetical protein
MNVAFLYLNQTSIWPKDQQTDFTHPNVSCVNVFFKQACLNNKHCRNSSNIQAYLSVCSLWYNWHFVSKSIMNMWNETCNCDADIVMWCARLMLGMDVDFDDASLNPNMSLRMNVIFSQPHQETD